MITVTAHINSKKFKTFPAYADMKLREAVSDGIEAGDNFMTGIVPRGQSSRLASAVTHQGPISVAPGHHIGAVGVDQGIAPYADKVNAGTGVDGPFHQSVKITRPARRGYGRSGWRTYKDGAMRFQKEGEPIRFRNTVKFRPSMKIEAGKGFHRKTFVYMREWTRTRVGVLTLSFGRYFARGNTIR